MPLFIIYLIKANIALVIFYLAYRFGLRRLTFYTLNRLFLLFGIAFSIAFPLVNVSSFFSHHEKLAGSVTYYAVDWQALQQYLQPESFTLWNMLEYAFWAGVAIMTIRFCIQLLSLLHLHHRTKDGILRNEKVKLMSDRINPFSFFKNIYINPSLHTEEELNNILMHEHIHVKGWHSLDIIISELNHIFYWFNPGAWLMKTAIRENLEFITDRKILESGMDVKTYQYNLLKVSSVPFAVSIANNFNFSHLKQRIRMMNKKSSSGYHILRYLILLPVIAGIILVGTSSRSQNKGVNKIKNEATLKMQQNETVSKPDSNTSGDYKDFLKRNPSVKNLEYISVKNKGLTLIYVELKNGRIEKYHLNNQSEMKVAREKYGSFPTLPDSNSSIPPTTTFDSAYKDFRRRNLGVKYLIWTYVQNKGYTSVTVKLKNGSEETYHFANPNEMKIAEEKYGKIPIPSSNQYREGGIPHSAHFNSRPTVIFTPPKVVKDMDINSHNNNRDAMLAYQAAKEKDYDKAFTLAKKALQTDPENSEAKQVMNYIRQMKAYQLQLEEYKQNKNETRIITDTVYPDHHVTPSVKPKVKFTPPKAVTDTSITNNKIRFRKPGTNIVLDKPPKSIGKAIFIIDGRERDSVYLKHLHAGSIQSISVIKGQEAVSLYGEKGKNGVIRITTKPKAVTLKSDGKYHPMTSSNTIQTIDTAFFTPTVRNLNSVGSNPIYILNNKVIDKETFKSISPADIKSITILKDSSAITVYGKKGADGVIKIETKDKIEK